MSTGFDQIRIKLFSRCQKLNFDGFGKARKFFWLEKRKNCMAQTKPWLKPQMLKPDIHKIKKFRRWSWRCCGTLLYTCVCVFLIFPVLWKKLIWKPLFIISNGHDSGMEIYLICCSLVFRPSLAFGSCFKRFTARQWRRLLWLSSIYVLLDFFKNSTSQSWGKWLCDQFLLQRHVKVYGLCCWWPLPSRHLHGRVSSIQIKCLERSWHCITCMQRMSPASVLNNALKTLAALLTKAATVCASVGACPLQLPQGNRSINVRGNLDQPFDREGVRRFKFFHCQVVAPIWVIWKGWSDFGWKKLGKHILLEWCCIRVMFALFGVFKSHALWGFFSCSFDFWNELGTLLCIVTIFPPLQLHCNK